MSFVAFPSLSILPTFIQTLTQQLESNRAQIEALLDIKEKTYENFVRPFEMIDERLDLLFTPLSHMNSVINSEHTQEIYSLAIAMLTDYGTDIGQDLRIYEAFKAIKVNQYKALDAAQQMVLDQSIQGFELSGAHLDADKKARLKEINLRKSDLSNQFSQNVLNATQAFELILTDAADVEGLPQSDIQAATCEREGKSCYRFTLQMPSYIAYMTYGPNRYFREKLYEGYVTRAPENAKIIDEMLALRKELAHILGFESYAALSIETKMAPSTDDVVEFLSTLQHNSKAQAQEELNTLRAFAKTQGCDDLQSYDTMFYAQKLRERDFDIDEEAYRPYFEQHSVVRGLFDFCEKLLHIRFVPVQESLWDTKAQAYDIYDDGKLHARLYLDLEARDTKKGGAWMHNWQTHCVDEAGHTQLASAFIVCNFPPSTPTAPSLLRHDDVVTLFHEMGHALHHLLSRVSEVGVSGVNGIEWDAVEFPSQFLENFAYEPQVLTMFAKHYQTGEILPQEMIAKLVNAKDFQSAMMMLRQLEFSLFDFKLHMQLHQGNEVQELLDSVRAQNDLLAIPAYNKFQNSFSHIFSGGYSAGYYSYKWAEVLSADAFYYFVDHGIFDKNIAKKYKEIILAQGASVSMEHLFKAFRGQELDTKALLRLNGIKVA